MRQNELTEQEEQPMEPVQVRRELADALRLDLIEPCAVREGAMAQDWRTPGRAGLSALAAAGGRVPSRALEADLTRRSDTGLAASTGSVCRR